MEGPEPRSGEKLEMHAFPNLTKGALEEKDRMKESPKERLGSSAPAMWISEKNPEEKEEKKEEKNISKRMTRNNDWWKEWKIWDTRGMPPGSLILYALFSTHAASYQSTNGHVFSPVQTFPY